MNVLSVSISALTRFEGVSIDYVVEFLNHSLLNENVFPGRFLNERSPEPLGSRAVQIPQRFSIFAVAE
jgi:hypothetical protein